MIFSKPDLSYDFACRKEYLLVSGDCYSSSSLAGNTRKYHGVLVKDGYVLLSTVDEIVDGCRISRAIYRDAVVCPDIYSYFHPARFCYWVDGVLVERRVELGKNTARIFYRASDRVKFELLPLLAMRSVHSVRKDFEDVKRNVSSLDGSGFVAKGLYNLRLEVRVHDTGERDEGSEGDRGVESRRVDYIYYDVFYPRDCERGYECCENLYSPYLFSAVCKSIELIASVEGYPTESEGDKGEWKKAMGERVLRVFTPESMLERACDAFLRDETVVAGYHWFTESWGRDTFVSLPGLLLERGMFGQARKVFLYFARRMKDGLIPNRIGREVTYNSSDASLWFIYALGKYMEKTGDKEFLYRIKVYLEELFSSYPESDVAELKGKLIKVKPQTTWMDTVFTPREGKPVEINALWINALAFAERYGIEVEQDWRETLKEFWKTFWNGSYLNDLENDSSFRPNQVIALAIITGILKDAGSDVGDMREEIIGNSGSVIELCDKKLLTPFGLRTLSRDDENYVGRYCGDRSYHNGCVWPWLIGFYFDLRKNAGMSLDRSLLNPLLSHLYDCGIGFVSEIFDGDKPYNPNGCIAQAWSVAELYRALKMC